MKFGRLTLILTTAIILLIPNPAFSQQKSPIYYVAIGDSLAAGQTPHMEIDTGYSDLIAQELSRHLPVAAFSKNLSFPGFTTSDVLGTVRKEEAQEVLQQANLITISAGANDLLRMVWHDVRSGTLSFQQIQADLALNRVRINMMDLLSDLKKNAPAAEIYVMGYYFPYPYVQDTQKSGIADQLDRLNNILKNEAKRAGVHFVHVSEEFGQNARNYLPNPTDVHPNMEGYRVMANSFLDVMTKGTLQINSSELPEQAPKSFKELSKQRSNHQKDETVANRVLPLNLYVVVEELHQH